MDYILLVDGDDDARLQTREKLMLAGYQTDTAKTGAEALEALTDKRYICIVTDAELPDMNGVSLCEEIRKISQAPLLFLSEMGDTEDDKERRIHAFAADCDGFMEKSVDVKVLAAWLHNKVVKYRSRAKIIRDG